MEMSEKDLIEQLADKEHKSWAGWMKYFFSKCREIRKYEVIFGDADSEMLLVVPIALIERWKRQIETSYEQLSEQEKQSDRDEVAHILPIIEAYKSSTSKEITLSREFFEHLLNCMCNQKALPTLDRPMSDREKHDQEIIDKAYHQARDLLSGSLGEANRNPLLDRPLNPKLQMTVQKGQEKAKED